MNVAVQAELDNDKINKCKSSTSIHDTTDSNSNESDELTLDDKNEHRRYLTELKVEPSIVNFNKQKLSTLLINLENGWMKGNNEQSSLYSNDSRLKVNENSNNIIYKLKTKFLFKTRLVKS
jgi:hypothetical protein